MLKEEERERDKVAKVSEIRQNSGIKNIDLIRYRTGD